MSRRQHVVVLYARFKRAPTTTRNFTVYELLGAQIQNILRILLRDVLYLYIFFISVRYIGHISTIPSWFRLYIIYEKAILFLGLHLDLIHGAFRR